MDKINIDTMPDEKFAPAPILKGSPVEHEEIFRNIRESHKIDVPLFHRARSKMRRGTAVFIAGGPTLQHQLGNIRHSNHFLITSNNTYDWLISKAIVADACLIIDPKEQVKDYIQHPLPETTFYVASVCNPQVYYNLLAKGANVIKILCAYGMDDDEDVNLQAELYGESAEHFLVGGTMTALRAMPFANMLGFDRLEYYGFDSCFAQQEPIALKGTPRYEAVYSSNGGISYKDLETNEEYVIDEPDDGGFFYAYKKKRHESICIVMTSDGRRFLTSPGFANQARQICKWVDRMEGKLDVVIHGDSLSSNLLRIHQENLLKAKAEIGDRRWTDDYERQQHIMHERGFYGIWGDDPPDVELVGRTVCAVYAQTQRRVSVLDYGCGNGAMRKELTKIFNIVDVTGYDPFHPDWRGMKDPGMHDITTCFDVMEHVEQQCVDNTLKYIAERTRYAAMFAIALVEAKKMLPDGRNAHITLKSAPWWLNKINQYFVTLEAKTNNEMVYIFCQKQDCKQQIESMREAA